VGRRFGCIIARSGRTGKAGRAERLIEDWSNLKDWTNLDWIPGDRVKIGSISKIGPIRIGCRVAE
jgi:hypothetical protein